MFEWLTDFFKQKKTTSLEDYLENKAYINQRLEDAKKKGQGKAKEEIRQAIKEAKQKPKQGNKLKSAFSQLQDFADNFANQPSYFGGKNGKTKTSSKASRSGSRNGFHRF